MIIIRIRSIRSSVAVPKPFWRGSPIVHHTVSDSAEPVDRLIGQRLAIKRDCGFSPHLREDSETTQGRGAERRRTVSRPKVRDRRHAFGR